MDSLLGSELQTVHLKALLDLKFGKKPMFGIFNNPAICSGPVEPAIKTDVVEIIWTKSTNP